MTDTQSTALAITTNEAPAVPALLKTPADCEAFYSGLDASIADEARQAAAKIHVHIGHVKDAYVDAGRELLAIKGKLKHGQFGKWLNAEFGLTERTAQQYMKCVPLADAKPAIISALKPTAVLKLAAPSTPQAVIDEVEARINKGEVPSIKEIDDSICVAKQRQTEVEYQAREERRASAEKAKRRARNDEGKTTEEIEKANKRRAAADGRAEAKRLRDLEKADREREEAEANVQKAVKFLRDQLGEKLAEFQALFSKADPYQFIRVLRSLPAPKAATELDEAETTTPVDHPHASALTVANEAVDELSPAEIDELVFPEAA